MAVAFVGLGQAEAGASVSANDDRDGDGVPNDEDDFPTIPLHR